MNRLQVCWAKTGRNIHRFAGDQSGATAIEYGLIAFGIAVAIIISVNSIGSAVKGGFTSVAAGLN